MKANPFRYIIPLLSMLTSFECSLGVSISPINEHLSSLRTDSWGCLFEPTLLSGKQGFYHNRKQHSNFFFLLQNVQKNCSHGGWKPSLLCIYWWISLHLKGDVKKTKAPEQHWWAFNGWSKDNPQDVVFLFTKRYSERRFFFSPRRDVNVFKWKKALR